MYSSEVDRNRAAASSSKHDQRLQMYRIYTVERQATTSNLNVKVVFTVDSL